MRALLEESFKKHGSNKGRAFILSRSSSKERIEGKGFSGNLRAGKREERESSEAKREEREESVSPVRLLYCPSAVLGKKFSDKLCEKGIFPLVERHAKDGSLIAVREENGKAAELACCEILSLNMSAF